MAKAELPPPETPAPGAMTGPAVSSEARTETPDPAAPSALLPALAELEAHGAAARAPVRFAYLTALGRRAQHQPPVIRARLLHRLAEHAAAFAADLARPTTPIQTAAPSGHACSPLATLLASLEEHASTPMQRETASPPHPLPTVDLEKPAKSTSRIGHAAPELKAVAYFREAWSRLSTEQQLTQTLAQAPDNAGPMNSQHLVLRSLQVMRDIAPDYLQGFMSYIDTLIWLEQVDPTKTPTGKQAEKKPRTARKTI